MSSTSTTLRQCLPLGVTRTSSARKWRYEDVASTEFPNRANTRPPAFPGVVRRLKRRERRGANRPPHPASGRPRSGRTRHGPWVPWGHRRQRRREGSASGPVRNPPALEARKRTRMSAGRTDAGLHEGHSRGPPGCPLLSYYCQDPKSDFSQHLKRV